MNEQFRSGRHITDLKKMLKKWILEGNSDLALYRWEQQNNVEFPN